MSEQKSTWRNASALCARAIRFVLDFPAQRAAERKRLDEEIIKRLPEGFPPDYFSAEEMRAYRKTYRKLEQGSKKQTDEKIEKAVFTALADAIASAEKTEATRVNTKRNPHHRIASPDVCG